MTGKKKTSFLIISFVLIFDKIAYGDWLSKTKFLDGLIVALYIIGIAIFFNNCQEKHD